MARSYVMMRECDNGTAGCAGRRCPDRDGERVGRVVVLLVVSVGGVLPARSPRATFAPIGRSRGLPCHRSPEPVPYRCVSRVAARPCRRPPAPRPLRVGHAAPPRRWRPLRMRIGCRREIGVFESRGYPPRTRIGCRLMGSSPVEWCNRFVSFGLGYALSWSGVSSCWVGCGVSRGLVRMSRLR